MKDVIISGGENISTIEVEQALAAPPGGARVRGRRDPRRALGRAAEGVRDAAATAPRRAARRSSSFCREHLAHFKVPGRGRVRRAAQDLDRQGPEVRAARARVGRPRGADQLTGRLLAREVAGVANWCSPPRAASASAARASTGSTRTARRRSRRSTCCLQVFSQYPGARIADATRSATCYAVVADEVIEPSRTEHPRVSHPGGPRRARSCPTSGGCAGAAWRCTFNPRVGAWSCGISRAVGALRPRRADGDPGHYELTVRRGVRPPIEVTGGD